MFFLLALLMVVLPSEHFGQGTSSFGYIPVVNLNKKLPKGWSFNTQLESRIKHGSYLFINQPLLYDLSGILAKKISLSSSLTAGYLMRLRQGELIHRFIQQINMVRPLTGITLAHRIASDLTLREAQAAEFRLRYRITGEIPLSGQTLDPREYYIKSSNEYLGSQQTEVFDLEVRAAVFLGYTFNLKNKFECGLDYRIDNFLQNAAVHKIWFGINFYHVI